MLITALLHFRPEGHREPRNEVGSLSPAKRLMEFEPENFRFWLQRLNQLGHSALRFSKIGCIVKNFNTGTNCNEGEQ